MSSGGVSRLNESTPAESLRLNASANFIAVSLSLALNAAGNKNRASNRSPVTRVTNSMPPRPGISPAAPEVSRKSSLISAMSEDLIWLFLSLTGMFIPIEQSPILCMSLKVEVEIEINRLSKFHLAGLTSNRLVSGVEFLLRNSSSP